MFSKQCLLFASILASPPTMQMAFVRIGSPNGHYIVLNAFSAV